MGKRGMDMNKVLRGAFAPLLAAGLVLGSFRGYVALYDKGKEEPRMVYPYAVAGLPIADRQALEVGIPVANEDELCRFLEDYLS